jgi:hypothetical protein
MAKGIRSKVKKRYRTAKRELVNATVEKKRLEEANRKIGLVAQGRIAEVLPKAKTNGFLYPDDPDSAIPQNVNVKPLDFRSHALPGASNAAARGRRKFTEEEKARRKVVAVEGPGAFSGKFAGDIEESLPAMEVDGEENEAPLFVEDTTATTVENSEIQSEIAKAKSQGQNVVWAPLKPGASKAKAGSGGAPLTKGKKQKK